MRVKFGHNLKQKKVSQQQEPRQDGAEQDARSPASNLKGGHLLHPGVQQGGEDRGAVISIPNL